MTDKTTTSDLTDLRRQLEQQRPKITDGTLNGASAPTRSLFDRYVLQGGDVGEFQDLVKACGWEQQSPFDGLPAEARFLNVRGKAPVVEEWNRDSSKWLTAEAAMAQRASSSYVTRTSLITGGKVGRLCWLDFDGEAVDDKGEVLVSATADFEFLFHRPSSDLPPAPSNTSGKPGRRRLLFKVPPEWADCLSGLSFNNAGPTKSFDTIYEKARQSHQHAVIDGLHKDGNGYYYRWEEGCSPSDIPIPDLQTWVIQGLIIKRAENVWREQQKQERAESRGFEGGGEAGPMDLLHPGLQRKLLNDMQKFWPYRAPRDRPETEDLGRKGDYTKIRALVLSLAKGIGDFETMALWLEDGHWDRLNDWAGEQQGVNPVNGGSLMSLARSLMGSNVEGEEVKPWATAWAVAVENGWKPPKWALPPRELDVSKLAAGVVQKVEQLKKALVLIDEMDSPLDREVAMQNLSKALECREKEFKTLLQHVLSEQSGRQNRGGDFNDVVARAKPIEVAVERLLAFNALTVVGSDGGVGKTVLLYRLAEAAANG